MKALKKSLALLLALMLTLALGTTAFAAGETYTITINNEATEHTYEAYQIFAGDLSTNDKGEKVLSNIVWGSGINDAGKTALLSFGKAEGEAPFADAAELAKSLTTTAQAQAFAKEVAPHLTNPTTSGAQVDGKYTITGLSAGYYLVKDQDNTLSNTDDFYTAYIMQVVGDVEASPKGDKPELKKEIYHNDKQEWAVVGDNQIGDTVEFRIITTIPDITGYNPYAYKICDTMSAGLTSNVTSASDVTIKVNDSTALGAEYYSLEVDATDGNKFVLTIHVSAAVANGALKAGDKLYTYYSGVLNENAKVYNEGKQDNKAYLLYSNNPNGEGIGKTAEVTVYDWTFKMQVNKVDKDEKPLTGAKFVLSKNGALKVADMACNDKGEPTGTGTTGLIGLVKVEDGVYRIATDKDAADTIVYAMDAGSPVIKGLDDNTDYYLYETLAPKGYNLLDGPVQFKITAEYTTDGSALLENYPTVKVGTSEASTTLSTNVINKEGSVLPSTGGMGTTLFYILGGLLVVGAGVVLVTKKRMSKSEN